MTAAAADETEVEAVAAETLAVTLPTAAFQFAAARAAETPAKTGVASAVASAAASAAASAEVPGSSLPTHHPAASPSKLFCSFHLVP